MRLAFTILNPFAAWRLRRRVKGGVKDGTDAEEVVAQIGEPASKTPGDQVGEEIWSYELGALKGRTYTYSLLMRDRAVAASWWEEHWELD